MFGRFTVSTQVHCPQCYLSRLNCRGGSGERGCLPFFVVKLFSLTSLAESHSSDWECIQKPPPGLLQHLSGSRIWDSARGRGAERKECGAHVQGLVFESHEENKDSVRWFKELVALIVINICRNWNTLVYWKIVRTHMNHMNVLDLGLCDSGRHSEYLLLRRNTCNNDLKWRIVSSWQASTPNRFGYICVELETIGTL